MSALSLRFSDVRFTPAGLPARCAAGHRWRTRHRHCADAQPQGGAVADELSHSGADGVRDGAYLADRRRDQASTSIAALP